MAPSQCPLCRQASGPAFVAGGYRMFRCLVCRSAFLDPMPDEATLARFYDEFHRSAAQGGWYDDAEGRMQADFPAKVRLVRKALGPGKIRLLDVGCGKGFFLKACTEAGIEATGIDLSASGVAYAKDTLHMNALCGHLNDVKKDLGTFDAISFWATIEHLPDPIAVLKDLHGLLRPGGHLFCDTGIAADWLERLLPGLTQWYDPPQHLFVFSAQGITKALEHAGFTVVRLDPCFERTRVRRLARITRNALLAAGFRTFAWLGRMHPGPAFEFTRYPLGNLMTIEAVKKG